MERGRYPMERDGRWNNGVWTLDDERYAMERCQRNYAPEYGVDALSEVEPQL